MKFEPPTENIILNSRDNMSPVKSPLTRHTERGRGKNFNHPNYLRQPTVSATPKVDDLKPITALYIGRGSYVSKREKKLRLRAKSIRFDNGNNISMAKSKPTSRNE